MCVILSKGIPSTPQHSDSHPCTRLKWIRSLSVGGCLSSPLWLSGNITAKKKRHFSKMLFFCFCLRVTDMSYRNVSGTSNNCQALSVLIFNCSARVLKRMRETNGCNKSNSKTHFCALGCRRKHWRKIDIGISQLSLRLLLHRNTKRNLPLRELCF